MTPDDQQFVYRVLEKAYVDLYALQRSLLAALDEAFHVGTPSELRRVADQWRQGHATELAREAHVRLRDVFPEAYADRLLD